MRYVLEVSRQQLPFRIAQQFTESRRNFQPPPVEPHFGHHDERESLGPGQLRGCFPQRLSHTLSLLKEHGQTEQWYGDHTKEELERQDIPARQMRGKRPAPQLHVPNCKSRYQ